MRRSKTRNTTQLITPSTFRQAMSNPGGSREELATNSRVDEAATTLSTLLDLPLELILRIASKLEVRDLLALRKVRSKLEKTPVPTGLPGRDRVAGSYIALLKTNSSGEACFVISVYHYREL